MGENRKPYKYFPYVPYRLNDDYSKNEWKRVVDYMHMDFPAAVFESNGYGKIIVENPPQDICSPGEWKSLVEKILIPETQNFHPAFRKIPIIVRLFPKMIDIFQNTEIGGTGKLASNEYLVRIPYKFQDGELKRPIDILFTLMHEVCERDFWYKTKDDDTEAHSNEDEIDLLREGEVKLYDQLLDEKIANRRALRALRRVWPNATTNSFDYPEDS